ncbi:c-type cytochrome biogenesis protein CcsB [Corynebacterium cystitidis]|uniref:Cytochrome c-type biogenesis protein CcsB n=1 Tax=Corynebacterium cystitidis DSM 20524 TaxID=1121357 RepID=A0A1H9VJZ4_9CORY|nr:c-type cytochrome biogenesis protein CcsB [Corynebacterium cystitidis]WJY81422.1 Cytochrome c biogenesis protein CcsA [Corynebacterium cystitidis DSM 20524]SES21523.1 cytochrome c-type biogenesis protein CcsB [Corynebacterium cystitidis DSM 20524]SNV87582.1 cytochrome c assembly membrane protein [Corynebacterium cystitidis]
MNVNTDLAELSDLSFLTAYIIYFVALIVSLIHYGRMQGVIDMRRMRDAQQVAQEADVKAEEKALVSAGGGSSTRDFDEDHGLIDEPFDQAEYDRRVKGARKFAGMTQALVWFGIALHLVSVVTRGLAAQRFPGGNMYEYIALATLITMVVAAIVAQKKNWHTMWPWVLTPMVILMFINNTALYIPVSPLVPALQSHWLPVHISSVAGGASIGMVSGVFALLYLLRIWQPKGKEHGFFGAVAKPLPSAKTLDSLTYKTAIITLPVFGIGILLGAVWAEASWGRPWGWDPKETVSLISWILYAAYLHARATAGWKNYKAAWINVLALATTIFNLFFINMVVSGLHSYAGLN